jgi:hypothetical protein
VTHDEIGERTNNVRHYQHNDQTKSVALPAQCSGRGSYCECKGERGNDDAAVPGEDWFSFPH